MTPHQLPLPFNRITNLTLPERAAAVELPTAIARIIELTEDASTKDIIRRLTEMTRRLHARSDQSYADNPDYPALFANPRSGAPIQWGNALIALANDGTIPAALMEQRGNILDELRQLWDATTKLVPIDDQRAHCMQEAMGRLATKFNLSEEDRALLASLSIQYDRYSQKPNDTRLAHEKGGYLTSGEDTAIKNILLAPLDSKQNHLGPIGNSGFVWAHTANGYEPQVLQLGDIPQGHLLRNIPLAKLVSLLAAQPETKKPSTTREVLQLAIQVKNGQLPYNSMIARLRADYPPDPLVRARFDIP